MDYQKYIDIVHEQQKILQVDGFTREDALNLGNLIIANGKKLFPKPISCRIDLREVTVFFHIMDGASIENENWMRKKLNVCRVTGESSFVNHLLIEGPDHYEGFEWALETGSYATRGGCVPIKDTKGETYGWVMVSGLAQEEDHQLNVQSMAEYLGREIPTVLDGGFSFVKRQK